MIQVEDLRRTFSGTVALDGISFSVERGEVVGLLGPNGAGKTTCLRILSCFIPPSSGRVEVDGLDVQRHSVAVRRRLGYLPEGVPLYPELRVDEHLRFRARLRGIPRKEQKRAIERVVETCGLADVFRRIVGQLSRGYRQRLGLADALLGDPPLLVLDEPTVGLDPNQIREVRELVRRLGKERTVLLSSHILSEVEAVCDRVLIMHQGSLVAQGPVSELDRQAGTLVARVRGPVEQVRRALEELAGVEEVDVTESGSEAGSDSDSDSDSELELESEPRWQVARYRIGGEVGPRTQEEVAAVILAAGWGLQELNPARESLEHVFARLTAEEEE